MDINNTTNIGKVKLIMLKGEAGNSIESIEKTSETDTHEIYTITLTDGSTQQIAVAKGKGIVSIEKTATVGLVDTYTITFTDDSTTTFDIINGQSYTVPQNGVLYYTGSTVPEGFEETAAPSGSGQYAEIDDTTPSVSKTYSSQKIEEISLHHYSTTEHIVGKWIDGKDIWEKTYSDTTPSSTTSKNYSMGVSNVDKIIDYNGIVYRNDGALCKLDHAREDDAIWTMITSSNEFVVNIKDNQYTSQPIYFTIQYTKTS